MTDVIYLAPLCQKHERMWCEHDAPVDCECIDGPHPWIKYVAAMRQPTKSDIKQADTAAMESILWVDTIIDDQVAITKAFACHRVYAYDQGYYDGCAHTMDAWNRRDDVLREALEAAPLIGRTESVYDFMERQNAWLNGPYRAALEQSK